MYSNSRGSLKIKSKDPFEKPSIVFNYLSTKEDEQEWVEAIRVARNILSQKRWIHLMVVKFLRDHLYKQMKKYWTGCAKMVKQHYTHHAVQNGAGNRSNGSCRSTNNESPWHGEFARRGCFSNAKNYKWKHSRTGTYACRKAADIIRGKTIRTTIRRLLHPWQTRPQRWCNGTQSILPILMRPAERISTRNLTSRANWGGPSIERCYKHFHKQSR